MAICRTYSHTIDSTDEGGNVWHLYENSSSSVEDCGKSNLNEMVILDGFEYTELTALAGQTVTLDQAAASLQPEEVSAVFGVCFGLMVFLGYIGYQVRVGKNLINKI